MTVDGSKRACHADSMSDRSRKKKKDHDFAVTAFRVVQEATREAEEPQSELGPEPTPEERHAAAVG